MDKPDHGVPPAPPEEHFVTVTVQSPQGLHLRTGKDVVQVAKQFQSAITAQNLTRHSDQVDVKSILQLMQLQARQGHTLYLRAVGPDAADALTALCLFFGHASASLGG